MKFPLYSLEDSNRHISRAMLRYGFLSDPQKVANLDLSKVIGAYFESPQNFNVLDFNAFSDSEILDYLEFSHELYLNKYIPEIEQSIQMLIESRTEQQPKILLLGVLFRDYVLHLEEHIEMENNQLFPVIKRYISQEDKSQKSQQYSALADFYKQHTDTEKDLKYIHALIEEINPNHEQKSIFQVLKSQIKWIETDLSIHSKIEEEVLMPRIMSV